MKGYVIKIEVSNLDTGDKSATDSTFYVSRPNEAYNALVQTGLKQLKETIENAEIQAIQRGKTL